MLAAESFNHTEIRMPAGKATSVAERMAELFVRNERRGYVTDRDDLKAEGFEDHELTTANHCAAVRIAKAELADRDIGYTPEYDREGRIEKAANIIAGMMLEQNGQCFTVLRQSGFASIEIGNLFPDIIDRSCQLMVEARATVQ